MNNPILYPKKYNLIFILVLTFLAIVLPFKTAASSGITKDSIIELTNKNRQLNNSPVLIENDKLDMAAFNKALDMININYFDHYSPFGATPWNFIITQNYDYSYAGENLAMDFDTSEGIIKAWMNSPTHAKNILNPIFHDIGVAVIDGNINGSETTLVVQMFGSEQKTIFNSILDMPVVQTVSKILGIK